MHENEVIDWRHAIGPNADRYISVFDRIGRKGGGWVPGWNTAAFLHSTGWFCYSRMHGFALLNLIGLGLLWIDAALGGVLTLMLEPLPRGTVIGIYGFIVFVVAPMFADALYFRHIRNRLARTRGQLTNSVRLAPSGWTRLGAVALGMVWLFGLFMLTVFAGYGPRAKMSEAVLAAGVMKVDISEFYYKEKRLPTSADKQFRPGPQPAVSNVVESVVYDSAAQAIIITIRQPFPGKRIALPVEVRDGKVIFGCRTVDIPPKFVPAECRP